MDYLNKLIKQNKADCITKNKIINNISFIIKDYKLKKFKEDELYNNETIRNIVSRGLCYVMNNDTNNTNNTVIHILRGHRKFGNEGEYINTGTLSELNEVNNTYDYKIFRKKENGECMHIGAFEYLDEKYIIIGSKNVHIIVRKNNTDTINCLNQDDILLYTEERYKFALKIAELLQTINLNNMIDYLIQTKYTICGEACFISSPHIVDYFNKENIYFFALIDECGNTIHPSILDNLLNQWDLCDNKITETVIAYPDKYAEVSQYFIQQYNSEGAVVNCIINEKIVYVYKLKNHDYVFWRAVREQMNKKVSTKNLLKRIDELYILDSTHLNINIMKDNAIKFNAFYRLCYEDTNFDLHNNFVKLRREFINLSQEQKNEYYEKFTNIETNRKTINIIMFIGIPGSGKTYLGEILLEYLRKLNYKCVHLEQDMFYSSDNKLFNKNNLKNIAKKYHKEIQKTLEDINLDYLILTKSNHNYRIRKYIYDICNDKTNVEINYVILRNYNIDICIDRIIKRGCNHKTLFNKSKEELYDILNGFIKSYEELRTEEQKNKYIELDVSKDKDLVTEEMINKIDLFYVRKNEN